MPGFDDPISSGLNPSQHEAVTTMDGPLLVIAGAGSGKTRVITRRIAHLVQNDVDASRILAVTFTNKAAREMRERVEALIPWGQPRVLTFHAFGARFLREEAPRLGRPQTFSLFDRGDSESAIKRCLDDLKLDKTNYTPRSVLEAIGRFKSRLIDPEGAEEESLSRWEEDVARVYAHYEVLLERSGAFDFDDLVEKTARLVEDDAEIRQNLSQRFQYLLVDEYQDVNHAQYRLTRVLSEAHKNLCVTGDPDQCIYGWRGAELRYILDFPEEFPDAKVVRLEQNYRSTNRILKGASALIRFNSRHGEKDLWSELGEGAPIVIRRVADEQEEARAVVARIDSLRQAGARRSDIAVFYRLNSLSLNVERHLLSAGVPYQVVQGLEFFKRKEVKDVLAWLRFLANPADEVSLTRVIVSPPRGIGAKTLDSLRSLAADAGVSAGTALLEHPEVLTSLSPRARKALAAFRELVISLRSHIEDGVQKLLRRLLDETKYARHLEEKAEGLDPLGNIEQLIGFARDHDQGPNEGGLVSFLEEVALFSEVDSMKDDEDRCVLMTVHASKGLEFPHVIVIGMEAELFPHVGPQRAADIEEERRLFYVAMTRAQESLTLLTTSLRTRFGRMNPAKPSIFLTEIPEDLTEVIDDVGGFAEPDFDRSIEYEMEDELHLRRGARVKHANFGPGTVSGVSGRGDRAKIEIDFDTGDRRRFLARHAPIEPLDGWD